MAQMLKEDLQFNAGKAADEVNRGGELVEYTPEQFGAVGMARLMIERLSALCSLKWLLTLLNR